MVKLVAMILVGVFVCFIMFDGPVSIFNQLVQLKPEQAEAITKMPNPITWVSFLILAASAFFMLPRQFHVMVVENSQSSYIKKAQWLLPLYLFLITIFVIPIASAGALVIGPDKPDMYMLTLPQSEKQIALSVIVFVGGFSASMAMLMVSGMTLSNMFSNHLALPTLRKFFPTKNFGQYLLQIRWLGVFLVLAAGQMFYLFLGETYLLVNIGLISFCAVLQFFPVIIAGLYWEQVNSKGALIGLSAGFIVWTYTMLFPAITKSGWVDDTILQTGLFGIELLRPEHLFGSNIDKVSHGAFWTLVFNISGLVIGSMVTNESDKEAKHNAEFLDIMHQRQQEADETVLDLPKNINLREKVSILLNLFERYFPEEGARDKVDVVLELHKLDRNTQINTQELANIEKTAERLLSGATGAAMAHVLIKESKLFTDSEIKELEKSYASLLSQLKISPVQLRMQLNYAKEKEKLAAQYNKQLEGLVDTRTKELQGVIAKLNSTQAQLIETEKQASLGKLVAGIAHEINTPVGICVTASTNLKHQTSDVCRTYRQEKLTEQALFDYFELCTESVDIITKNSERASNLIRSFKQVAVDQSADELRTIDISQYLDEITLSLKPVLQKAKHKINISCDQTISFTSYAGAISQLFTNLIMNSVIHAFKADQVGNIDIQVFEKEKHLYITYKDDGEGLIEEHAKSLFDPFFTTKRDEGGSG